MDDMQNSSSTKSTTGASDAGAQSPAQMASMFAGRQPDAEMAQVLAAMMASGAKPIETLDAKEARKQPTPADAVKAVLKQRGESTDPETVGDVDNQSIAGPAGDIEIRIYKPASAAEDRLLPLVLYIHGGGWVIADLDVYDASPRAIANAAHCVVVSTHYRQGPEHKFPAAHEDVYAAYKWAIANARDLGADGSRIAVLGESAGGNLAAAICLNARDEGFQLPVHQVLVYPIAGYDFTTESYREMTQAKPLNTPMMKWFFDKYLGSPAEGETPAISLDRADLSGLPPATIINSELDPLRSDGELLAKRFTESGVPADQRTFAGVTHEFFGMGAVLGKAREAQRMAAQALTRAFGSA
jgi:acetyl esterase/lipase